MNKRKIIVNKSEKRDSRWYGYKEVWINKWNIVCVKLVAIISFSVIISVIVVKQVNYEPKDEQADHLHENHNKMLLTRHNRIFSQLDIDQKVPANDCTFSICSYWGLERCCFHCYKINANIITETIKKRYMEHNCNYPSIILTLDEVIFEDSILKKNWWNINYYVTHLFFKSCYLKDIEDGALGKHFYGAITITFIRSQIAYYRKKMFTRMSVLADFAIQDSNLAPDPVQFQGSDPEGIKFEFGMLETFKNSLTTLQVQRSIIDPQAIRNLTGIELNKLMKIDFQFNEYLTFIPNDVFKAPNLIQLLISNNGLQKIDQNAFISIPNVKEISFENNKLETLDKILFSSCSALTKVYVSQNMWSCNCDLKFLSIYTTDLDKTTCNEGKLLSEIFSNCPTVSPCTEITTTYTTNSILSSTNSEILSSTTSTFSSETTTMSSTITSATTNENPETSLETTSSSYFVEEQACRNIRSNKFQVREQNGETVISYEDMPQPNDQFTLLSSQDSSCKFINRRGFINTKNTAFILCRQNSEDLDCYSGVTPAEYDQQIWLTNSEKIPAIAITIAVTIIASILTGFISYYCIRKHPKLLRGSKRIAFVETPPSEVIIMPPKPRTPVYLMPYSDSHYNPSVSYIPVRDPNYMTPISQRYMQVNEKYERPQLKRSLSDLSLKTVASYVTENQIMSSKRHNNLERSGVDRIFEEPPPLPPPRNRYEEVFEGGFRQRCPHSHYW